MVDAYNLTDFDKICRLFPLPGLVHFPHTVLQLHIFEPRYRQMTEDALQARDKLVTMVRLREPGTSGAMGDPPIDEVACLGRIIQHHRFDDGRFDLHLLGLKRVRLVREIASDRLYRLAEAEILEDQGSDVAGDPRGSELIALYERVSRAHGETERDLAATLGSSLELGVLTDLLSHALGLPAAVKQQLLAESHVDRRAEVLLQILRKGLVRAEGSASGIPAFPPPFSAN